MSSVRDSDSDRPAERVSPSARVRDDLSDLSSPSHAISTRPDSLINDDDEGSSDESYGDKDEDERSRSLDEVRYKVVPETVTDVFAEEPSYNNRPNRYYGAQSTWRSWTQEERAIAESLDRERASDLSAHLYNAHVLNDRTRTQSIESRGQQRALLKSGAVHRGDQSFAPPRVWTAWPLPPEEVPRETLMPRMESDAQFRGPEDLRPSESLEACLIATSARIARERWRARRWEWQREPDQDSKHNLNGESIKEDQTDLRDDPKASSEAAEDATDVQMFSSQAFHAAQSTATSPQSETGSDNVHKIDPDASPVIIADEDNARRLLLPSARHILSKLDDLLTGLHKARKVYVACRSGDKGAGAGEETTDTEGASVTSSIRSGSRHRSYSSRSGKRKRDSAEDAVDTDASALSSNPGRKRRSRTYGLRDWSDVLGMASLTGWDPNVVERASERCAALFDQNMLFRTFHEGNEAEKSHFTEKLANGVEPNTETEPQSQPDGHLGPCETDDQQPQRRSKLGSARPKSCPYIWCDRNKRPFSKSVRLERHIGSIHANDPPPVVPMFTGDEHVSTQPDEIFCPVKSCDRHQYTAFSKGAKLYKHVQKLHPEINITELKKLEAERRGERRGVYERQSSRKDNSMFKVAHSEVQSVDSEESSSA